MSFVDVLGQHTYKTLVKAFLGSAVSMAMLMAFYLERVPVTLQRAHSVAILHCSAAVEATGAGLAPPDHPMSFLDVGHVSSPDGHGGLDA